jgi:uncharacterized protein YihD (DUF1040 family)
MRDPSRIPRLISMLESYWEQNPDMRLCQIVSNLAIGTNFSSDPYYLEDDLFEEILRKKLSDLNASDN